LIKRPLPHRGKRGDINDRLLELQAKYHLAKIRKNMPAGHGRINFDVPSFDSKHGDIDARLLEIQSKILLSKAHQNMPNGHGSIRFDKI
jgi:hypothetical protein